MLNRWLLHVTPHQIIADVPFIHLVTRLSNDPSVHTVNNLILLCFSAAIERAVKSSGGLWDNTPLDQSLHWQKAVTQQMPVASGYKLWLSQHRNRCSGRARWYIYIIQCCINSVALLFSISLKIIIKKPWQFIHKITV